jgi:hypothetical protein
VPDQQVRIRRWRKLREKRGQVELTDLAGSTRARRERRERGMTRLVERHDAIIGTTRSAGASRAGLDPESALRAGGAGGDANPDEGREDLAPVTPPEVEPDERSRRQGEKGMIPDRAAQVVRQSLLERRNADHSKSL